MGQLCQGLKEGYCGERNTEEKLGLMVKEVLKCVFWVIFKILGTCLFRCF